MKYATRTTFVLSALFALVGCGGPVATVGDDDTTAVTRGRPAWERSPSALLPRDAFLVAHGSGTQIRRSPYFPLVETTMHEALDGGRDAEAQAVRALLRGVDDAWISLRMSSAERESGEALVVLRGAGVEAGMRQLIEPNMRHETKGSVELWHNGGDDLIVRLEAKTWLILIDGDLPALLARVDGTAPGDPLAEPRMRATAERVAFSTGAPLALVAHPPAIVRQTFAREGFPLDLLADAEYVAARLDPSNGLVVDLTADLTSADAAARADDALHGVISSYASNPMVALMGLSDILRRISVRSTGARVDVRASTTDEETRSLLQRYGELIGGAISVRTPPTQAGPSHAPQFAALSRRNARP